MLQIEWSCVAHDHHGTVSIVGAGFGKNRVDFIVGAVAVKYPRQQCQFVDGVACLKVEFSLDKGVALAVILALADGKPRPQFKGW